MSIKIIIYFGMFLEFASFWYLTVTRRFVTIHELKGVKERWSSLGSMVVEKMSRQLFLILLFS